MDKHRAALDTLGERQFPGPLATRRAAIRQIAQMAILRANQHAFPDRSIDRPVLPTDFEDYAVPKIPGDATCGQRLSKATDPIETAR